MRIGGLASGIDTESIIKDLMNAERIPLDKLEQDKTKIKWKRDAFRDVNMQISELERLITDMRLTSNTINPKNVTSTMEEAVTAIGNSDAENGSYKIAVRQLASNAVNSGTATLEGIHSFIADADNHGTVHFYTFDEEGNRMENSFEIEEGDTIHSITEKMEKEDPNIRAFYDEVSETLVLETRRSGDYNQDDDLYHGAEIGFDTGQGFWSLFDGLDPQNEHGGDDAIFYYNNESIEFTAKENRYTLNDITYTFNDVTMENGNIEFATLNVTNDVDAAIENITKIVDKFNELVETLNSSQNEPVYLDYPPLTEAQMEEMSERQIELWEERAKSGLLRREPIISSALSNYRSTWSMTVESEGTFRMLYEIGINTSEDYMDGGKLEIDEDALRKALEEDAKSVQQLLFNNTEGASRGLFNRLEDSLEGTIDRINERAGRGSYTNQMYTMGRELDQVEGRIASFQDRLQQVEDRYWRQFTAMERAISMMNNQSAMLMSFGGNMNQ